MLQPLIDGILTIAAAVLIAVGIPTAVYQWDYTVREAAAPVPIVEVVGDECVEVLIGWNEVGPYKISGGTPEIRTSVVGTYLWVLVGDPDIETGYVEDYVHSIPLTPGDDTVNVCL